MKNTYFLDEPFLQLNPIVIYLGLCVAQLNLRCSSFFWICVPLPNRMNFRKSSKGGGRVFFNPKIYVADFGNFKQGFLSMNLIQKSKFRVQGMFFNNCIEKDQNKTDFGAPKYAYLAIFDIFWCAKYGHHHRRSHGHHSHQDRHTGQTGQTG